MKIHKMAPAREPKGAKDLRKVPLGALWAPGSTFDAPGGVQCTKFGSHLGSNIRKNPEKTPSKKHEKIDAEKVWKMRAKSSQSEPKRMSKIIKKTLKIYFVAKR